MQARLKAVQKAIKERYRTPHRFNRRNPEIKRSTLYLILAGKYPGNIEKQLYRIESCLANIQETPEKQHLTLSAKDAYTVLQATKCANCRKLDKKMCSECNTQTMREAQAIADYTHFDLATKGERHVDG